MKRKTKLLVVTSYFYPDTGGVAKHTYNLYKNVLRNYRFEVAVVAAGEKYSEEKLLGLKVYRLPFWFKLSNTPISPLWFFQLKRLIKKENPDVVLAHTPVPVMADIAALVSKDKPFILKYHHAGSMIKGKFLSDLLIKLYEFTFLKLLFRKAEVIIAASDFVRLNFLKNYSSKCTTITPGVDIEKFKMKEKRKGNSILFVANLNKAERYKGLDYLLSAMPFITGLKKTSESDSGDELSSDMSSSFSRASPKAMPAARGNPALKSGEDVIRKEIEDASLTVVGDGDWKNHYKDLSKRLAIEKNVNFKGRLLGKKLVREYKKARLLVLPSLFESCPNVLLEAMAAKLPVIGTEKSGIPYVIEDGKNGLLFPPGDSKAIAYAVVRVLSDKKLAKRLGEHGFQKVSGDFSWDKKARQTVDLINRVLSSHYGGDSKSEQSKLKIVQVTHGFPPNTGGVQNVTKELSEGLAKKGHDVEVFSPTIGSEKGKLKSTENLKIHYLKSLEIAHTPIAPSLFFKLLKIPKNSIIHVHIARAFIPEIVYLVSIIKKIPYIAHFHLDVDASGKFGFLLPLYKNLILKKVLKSASRIVVFNNRYKALINKKYKISENTVVIPNGVSKKFFLESKEFLGKTANLLFVGRFSKQKNIPKLIKAIKLMKNEVSLHIVGEGEQETEIKKLISGMKNITLHGKKTGKELINLYKKADVFVLTSDKEGHPLVLLEAMAAGVPIVASDVIGNREFVKDVGILVRPPTAKNFAKELDRLLGDRKLRKKLSTRGKRKATKYSWDKMVTKFEDRYRKVRYENF